VAHATDVATIGSTTGTTIEACRMNRLSAIAITTVGISTNAACGNRAKAAQKLGIGAATLYRKLKLERQFS